MGGSQEARAAGSSLGRGPRKCQLSVQTRTRSANTHSSRDTEEPAVSSVPRRYSDDGPTSKRSEGHVTSGPASSSSRMSDFEYRSSHTSHILPQDFRKPTGVAYSSEKFLCSAAHAEIDILCSHASTRLSPGEELHNRISESVDRFWGVNRFRSEDEHVLGAFVDCIAP